VSPLLPARRQRVASRRAQGATKWGCARKAGERDVPGAAHVGPGVPPQVGKGQHAQSTEPGTAKRTERRECAVFLLKGRLLATLIRSRWRAKERAAQGKPFVPRPPRWFFLWRPLDQPLQKKLASEPRARLDPESAEPTPSHRHKQSYHFLRSTKLPANCTK